MELHIFKTAPAALIFTCGLAWLAQPCAAQQGRTPVQVQQTAARIAKSYPFPARADDLKLGEYWYRLKKIHGGYAKIAYDLDAVRYDSKEKVWTRYNPGIDPKAKSAKNSDWIAYGKNVYAIADGEVSGCWRNFPEIPEEFPRTPGEDGRTFLLRFARLPKSYYNNIPGDGNHLWIEHSDGSRTRYGHFQEGSIPADLCPFPDMLPAPGEKDQTKIPEGSRPKVKRGQYLGRVGSTGNSSNPHLHIQMVKDGDIPIPFQGVSVKGINNNPDAPSDWTRLEGEVLPPGPIAILPNDSEGPQGRSGNSEQAEARSRTK